MKKNGEKGNPIDVIEIPDGIYTTIDNTRVVSAREAGINVQANGMDIMIFYQRNISKDLQLRKVLLLHGVMRLV